MGCSLKRRSLASAVLASALVFGALALVSFATWASRDGSVQARQQNLDPAQYGEMEFAKKVFRPPANERKPGLSPLLAIQPVLTPPHDKRKHMIDTAIGFIDPGAIADLRSKAPLLADTPGRRLGAGKRGEIAPGFDALQISEAALKSRSMDDIASDLKGMGVKVHDLMESRTLLVEIPQGAESAVGAAGFVEAAMPWFAAFRVDPRLGRMPMIQASRARSEDLDVIVVFFGGTSESEARREVEEVAGPGSAAQFAIDGLSYETSVHYSKISRLAHQKRVRYVYERSEFALMNVETPTTAMVGNIKENLPFQKPYQDVGVDGGGSGALLCTQSPTRTCATNNDCTSNTQCVAAGNPTACCTGAGTGTCTGPAPGGVCTLQRYNNDTAAVPPQIVAVTDNGISADSVQFSHTATQVGDITHSMPSAAHRKVHAIQNVQDNGTSCDGTLSGSGTHGNIVAGVIAGDGTSVGFRVTKTTVNIRPKYENLEMDGVARGARILLQDAALPLLCTTNEMIEHGGNVLPGSLLDRLNLAICPKSGGTGTCAGITGGANEVHLHVMPFGTPNFDLLLQNLSDGTYPQEAHDIDQFLVNNRDYMVFAPVGHEGTNQVQKWFSNFNGQQHNQYPDLFDGSVGDNDPNIPRPLQVSPPATAKDLISVGGHFQDVQTQFSSNLEENVLNFTSKGPATAGSLRTAPLVVGVAADVTGFFNAVNTISVAVWRSRDNDNLGPVDAILDDANFGTSFASAEVAGQAALIRDYFAQGFYPTGARVTGDRVPNVSGPLVKAAVVASANFLEFLETEYPNPNDSTLAFTRAFNFASPIGGVTVGVIGNNEQGYGRPVLTSVLPLANWPKGKGIGTPNTIEYPSAGLIVYDEIATGEQGINNTRTVIEHLFKVDSDSTRTVGSSRVVDRGQLRIALAWADPPSAAGSAGALVNDIDLEVVSPGPDGTLDTPDDVVYDGNSYMAGGVKKGQWSLARPPAATDVSDTRNPVEAVHLSADPDGDGNPSDSQLVAGTWRVRVKRGVGGATAGQITVLTGASEDTSNAQCRAAGDPAACCTGLLTGTCTGNGNGRLDPGEDTDGDGFLDAEGQPYGLVIAGPVQGIGTQTIAGTARTFPASTATLDKSLYGCADQVKATIFDPGASAGGVTAGSVFEVVNKNGVVVDTENGFGFSGAGSTFSSAPLPLREGKPAVPGNGILETNGTTSDEPYFVRVRYTDTPRDAQASARISCTPNLLAWRFLIENQDDTQQDFIGGGCDNDQFLDSGENITYSVTFLNSNRDQDFSDVSATLTAGGPGASAIRVLNSPQSIGHLPAGQISGVTFALRVDPAALGAVAVANRVVDLTVTLQSTSGQIQLPRQAYTFRHALNSDNETFHYSTDFPGGGREIRDFNRNLQIDRPDITDPFLGIVNPDEDITFSSMFIPGTAGGLVTNTLGEDLNGNGILDGGEFDVIPNGVLDKGILFSSTGPTPTAAGDKVPWSFDLNSGGWNGFRHPSSRPGPTARSLTWEYVTFGQCGFQSAIRDLVDPNLAGFQNNGAGIWHTGDGDPTTPGTGNNCDTYILAANPATPPSAEFIEDFLVSPIIAKVHQTLDGRNLPYSAEFQRLGFNLNIETFDSLTGGSFNVDNNVDDDTGACLMCQEFDLAYGGIDYQVGFFGATGDFGFDSSQKNATRTFGNTTDPNGSVAANKVDGDETGFRGFVSVPTRTSPMPSAPPDLLPYPLSTAPVIQSCLQQPCRDWDNGANGPVRNVDFTLVGYAGGFVYSVTGQGGPSGAVTPFSVNPGVRWEIGIGFYNVELEGATADYGMGIDDVVFEWDERHPVDEAQFVPPHTPACNRFLNRCTLTGVACTSNAQCTGGVNDTCQLSGSAAGGQCATLSVDRSVLYECNDSLTVTVNDPKRAGVGSVQVLAASNSDARLFSTGVVTALHPHESFTIPEVPANSGLFTGTVTVSQSLNEPGLLYVSTSDTQLIFYYLDPGCDANGNGTTGQTDFDNLDGDGVAFNADNCPFDYNPLQEDGTCTAGTNSGKPCRVAADCGTGGVCLVDGDGIGSICDNCPGNTNVDQKDSDGDGVGDACDLDDIDFDGVVNSLDNCPDVYNPLQTLAQGSTTRGAACNQNGDRDGDGVQDRLDNCVRTANTNQHDADGPDGIGDACDGDCVGAVKTTLATGSCSRSSDIICTTNSQCPVSGVCAENIKNICTSSTQQCTCIKTCSLSAVICTTDTDCHGGAGDLCGVETCERQGITNSGSCGLVNDDLDTDGVPDALDDCPTIPNPAIIPNTNRQADQDNDGVGDACDSPFMVDGDNNGIPDDALSFALLANCGRVALPNIVVEAAMVHDINGDGDAFCDSGEKCRMTIAVRNAGPFPLTDVTLFLATDDSDIQCVSKPSMVVGSLPVGVTLDTSTLPGGLGYFEYTVSASTQTTSSANPARGDFTLSLSSREARGTTRKVGISTLLDLDLPTGAVVTAQPSNRPGVPAGTLVEDFDTDFDGNGKVDLSDGRNLQLNDTFGYTVGSALGGLNSLAGIGCFGYPIPPADNECSIQSDNDMDWHIHCPVGECDAPHVVGSRTDLMRTPPDGVMAFSGRNSLHWGRHVDFSRRLSDTTSFRALAAYTTNPINLTPLPVAGDLVLSFYHIADMMDNSQSNVHTGQSQDYGDVQIRSDRNPDPTPGSGDDWGPWDKLVPFENVYDHTPYVWSQYGNVFYCNLTPTDTGSAPPAPRGVHETMCYPLGVWSHCGNAWGTGSTMSCPGPGVQGSLAPPSGALWVSSKFNLSNYLGARVQIRWIAQGWEFDNSGTSQDYQTYGCGGGSCWQDSLNEDGWWIDDIRITGVITQQVVPVGDIKAPPASTCPVTPAGKCDPTPGDKGLVVALTADDANHNGIYENGESITFSTAGTTNPGGCVDGEVQYRVLKNGALFHDYSGNPTFKDSPTGDATYQVLARCTSNPACTTLTGTSMTIRVYTGDGADIVLASTAPTNCPSTRGAFDCGVTHDRTTGITTISWASRPQPAPLAGYDVFRGARSDDGSSGTPNPPDTTLATLATLQCNMPQVLPIGSNMSVTSSLVPAVNNAIYYLVGHRNTTGSKTVLGRGLNNAVEISPISCP